ncbi:sugar transferase [Streptomyces liangshanensis]|uniref:Sugar transferase n=1 Tax=Streptomyces liangshanensis TaxID=2717324 RepID=A0A6G9GZ82_9ACTN|nr:sugar transferase [Streptomyces liangshanensis]QIQ03592.1 sugar transferase [Streptomyces liangshanensis]
MERLPARARRLARDVPATRTGRLAKGLLTRAAHRAGDRLARLADPKRLLDLTLGSALLVLAAPALLAAALTEAVRARGSGRPVLAGDYRTGLHGHPFVLRSLRTRRFRLDLLSRLPHVVRGDLSLVGPAPLGLGTPAAAAPWRQLVRPGLTGLAQVRRHSPMPWDETPLLDQHYVEHHWIGLDLLILVRTAPALRLAAHPQGHVRTTPSPRSPARGRAPATQITTRATTLRRDNWVTSARTD